MNILIAVGSKYGSTRGIAERIADVLKQHGHNATVLDAVQVRNLAAFDGVVLGSGIYAGKLHGGLLKLAAREQAALAAKRVAAFSVSLSAAESSPEERAKTEAHLQPLRNLLTLDQSANLVGAFDPQSMSWPMRLLMKMIGAKAGDQRDWPAIEAWATELATAWA